MNNKLQPRNRMNLWLIGLIILLSGIILIEGGIILARQHAPAGDRSASGQVTPTGKPGWWRKLIPNRWLPTINPSDHQISSDDRMVLWESAQDIAAIHHQIDQLFSALSDSGAFIAPAFPDAFGLHPPATSARDHLFQLQQEINRVFESTAFNEVDIFNLPDRMEQVWNTSDISSSMHVDEQGSNYLIKVNLPGLDPTAIAISLQGRLLSIVVNQNTRRLPGHTGLNSTGTYSRQEHTETRILLPGPVDAATAQATYQNGILRIEIPKGAEQEPVVKPIKII